MYAGDSWFDEGVPGGIKPLTCDVELVLRCGLPATRATSASWAATGGILPLDASA